MAKQRLRLAVITIIALCFLSLLVRRAWAGGGGGPDVFNLKSSPPLPSSLFGPSNARTSDGQLIPSNQFFSASRCVSCHQDTHAAWAESLHRNAAREPFYKESVDILERQRGIEFTRHCESCHAPVSLFSGALTTGSKESRAMDDEGVTCTVCHSIVEARLDGTGSYTIRRPALIEKPGGTPVYGDLPNEAIMADILGHKRAMMRPLLKSPEFCAVCHKASAPPSLNNYKFLRGFNAYDEWQMSGTSTDTITPYYRRDKRADCRACHMPAVESKNDLAAKDRMIVSHRFLGANTITPLFYGQTKQVELTRKFLQDGVISADIFALKNEATGQVFAPLDNKGENMIAFQPGDEITAEVVVFNRKAAHSFPPELRDMYEPWVEFEAIDAKGAKIFHSGFIKPDKTLDESAHVYKAILLDSFSRVITRHQVWMSAIKAYDNFIPPGRSDLVRYRFTAPRDAKTGLFTAITLRARVNYRRFIQEYTDYVLQRNKATHLEIPVVRMAEATVKIVNQANQARATKVQTTDSLSPEQQARRWNDYGIALLEQQQYGQACEAFKRANQLNPHEADYLVSAAVAEIRMERYGPEREQLKKAAALLEAALKINPNLSRTRFYRAVVWRAEGKAREAAEEFAALAKDYPRDREVIRQLGQTLYALGKMGEAKQAFLTLREIDPTDAGAYQFLSPIFASEGLKAEAERANELYLLWRDDPLAEGIATRFFALNPTWAEVRIPYHVYSSHTPPRPVMSGAQAAPDK